MSTSRTGGRTSEHPLCPTTSQDLAYLNDRRFVECFAVRVVEAFGEECFSVLLLPWAHGYIPPGVVCPNSRGKLDHRQLEKASRGKSIAVIACTFKHKEEEDAAADIVIQLEDFLILNDPSLQNTFIVAAFLFGPEAVADRERAANSIDVFQRILSSQVNDVLLNPDVDNKASLRLQLKVARHAWKANNSRLQAAIIDKGPAIPHTEEYVSLAKRHAHLLWTEIPREMLPHFVHIDPDLVETDEAIGDYTLVKKLSSGHGIVWEAKNRDGESVAIKFLEKEIRATPNDVECINREHRFLNGFIRHPNIVRALDFLHSHTHIYLVLEHAGEKNLAQHLSEFPGMYLPASDAVFCFRQIVAAVSHCHSHEITHRNITLQHVVVKPADTGQLQLKLVDFYNALVCKPGVVSYSSCCRLPFLAPEVLKNKSYLPLIADCWSVGVVLLEMSGGIGSLLGFCEISEQVLEDFHPGRLNEESCVAVGESIRKSFNGPGQHENALAFKNGVRSAEILHMLTVLLREPQQRLGRLQDLLLDLDFV